MKSVFNTKWIGLHVHYGNVRSFYKYLFKARLAKRFYGYFTALRVTSPFKRSKFCTLDNGVLAKSFLCVHTIRHHLAGLLDHSLRNRKNAVLIANFLKANCRFSDQNVVPPRYSTESLRYQTLQKLAKYSLFIRL